MSYTADAGGQNMLRVLSSMCCNKEDSQSDCNSCTCTSIRVYNRSNGFCKLHGSISKVIVLTWAEHMRCSGLASVHSSCYASTCTDSRFVKLLLTCWSGWLCVLSPCLVGAHYDIKAAARFPSPCCQTCMHERASEMLMCAACFVH